MSRLSEKTVCRIAIESSSMEKLPWNGQWVFNSKRELLSFARAVADAAVAADRAGRGGDEERFRLAWLEWSEKTQWIQDDPMPELPRSPLGMHRADVVKLLVETLRAGRGGKPVARFVRCETCRGSGDSASGRTPCGACDGSGSMPYVAPPAAAVPEEWREVMTELADLMDDVVSGNYQPDSFTTQPARALLAAPAKQSGGEG